MQATRTYLQLTEPGQFQPAFGDFPDFRVGRVPRPEPELYRRLYRTVGAQYQWRDRWNWTDAEISAHLAQPEITLFVAALGDDPVGWYELRRVPEDQSIEIAYFGLLPAAIGRGLGKHLLSCAVRDAWAAGTTRVWLHTCTLDHPHALPNYIARGFAVYRTEQYDVETTQSAIHNPQSAIRFPRVNFRFQLTRKTKLIIAGAVLAPILLFAIYTWSALNWSYSEGERAGYVQKFSRKGWLCKTWEGELAMVSMPGTMPEMFPFTVRDDNVAQHINASLGKRVALTYQQHKGIPTHCFGETEYFVVGVRVVQ